MERQRINKINKMHSIMEAITVEEGKNLETSLGSVRGRGRHNFRGR